MAFTMKTVAPSTSLISARPIVLSARSARPVGGRARLVIEAKTVWQLAPQGGKSLEEINLTDAINAQKSFTSVGDKKHQDAEQVRAGRKWRAPVQKDIMGECSICQMWCLLDSCTTKIFFPAGTMAWGGF